MRNNYFSEREKLIQDKESILTLILERSLSVRIFSVEKDILKKNYDSN